ncbi:FecCD family ABC transporter permease [Nesterenkonia halotolerans]|uniref:FecCD family ABC transporter permease n=1 Tax=Nesterenkonia halotolerans TaxID=225325 RepID=UPI003EE55DCF
MTADLHPRPTKPPRLTHRPVRSTLVGAGLCLALIILSIIALGMGDYPLSPPEVLTALTGAGDFDSTVVLQWRLPRITAALVFGAALAVSGALFQTLTRNPLGSPDIIGFSTGAYTGVLLATVGIGGATLANGLIGTALGALLGGLGTALLVYFLAYRQGVQGFRLIVVGIGVTAALHAVNSWILLRAQTETAMGAAIWGAGSLGLTSWADVLPAIGIVLAVLPLLLMTVRPLRQLELGDDVAASHGVKVEPTRLVILGVGVLLTALVTAATGPIAFVALAAPQIARLVARSPGIPLVHSALMGALVLLGSDMIAQQALAQPIPVGMVTVILGGGYLAALLAYQARRD